MKTVLTTKDDPTIQTTLDLSLADSVVITNSPANIVASKIENDFYIADYIVQEVTNKDFYKEFGVLYRMISRAIDLKIYQVIMSMPVDQDNHIDRICKSWTTEFICITSQNDMMRLMNSHLHTTSYPWIRTKHYQ